MVSIAVDTMGGDHAPRAVVEGVDRALSCLPGIGRLILVGDETQIRAELDRAGRAEEKRLEVMHAPDVVRMDDPPLAALRGKKRSSITVAVELVKCGEAQAVVSAGNTGAAVAATVVRLKMLPGIERPGIATVFPSPGGHFVLLDAGANVDSKPHHLSQFAVMGDVYARRILGFEDPKIGILSVGTEDVKGNELTKQAFKLLSGVEGLNFVGNVEGNDLFDHAVDVVVCDGFVGNVVLKCSEGLAKGLADMLRGLLSRNPLRMAGALLSRGAFNELKELSDSERYGGAPLLGVNGVCIIGHGSSSPFAIQNVIRVATEFVEHQVNEHIVERLGALGLTATEW